MAVGTEFLRTEADGDVPNNLYALPQQAADVPFGPPAFPASLSPAREPTFGGIATSRTSQVVRTADSDGLLRVLPSSYAILQLEAPFSTQFEVLVNGDGPLYQAPTGTGQLPDALEQQGWWAFQGIGFWGRDPGTASGLTLERDRTRYQIRLRLPDAVLDGPRVSVLIAQRSLNSNCVAPQDKSSYLDLALARTVSTGGPAVGASGTEMPTAGVERISLWIQSTTDQFTFTSNVFDPQMNGAVIRTITNATTDKDGRPVRLVNVTHTDGTGAPGGPTTLEPGGSSSAFANLGVTGTWSLRATDLSAVFLDPRRVGLDVAWRRP